MNPHAISRRSLLKGLGVAGAHLVLRPQLLAQAAAPAPAANGPTATTTHGRIRGFVDQDINVFKGVPYGGDTAKRRFMAPVPPDPWTGVRDTLQFGPRAPQPGTGRSSASSETGPLDPPSEDCLQLNVWTPGLRDRAKRPVMVYIHGGGYNSLSANDVLYDGVRLCRRGDVVVVTLNHRLNAFGYLYLAELGGADFADSGNAGQLDLILAL